MNTKNQLKVLPNHVELDIEAGRDALQSLPVDVPTTPLNEPDLCDWIADSPVGGAIEYHRGLLLLDRSESDSALLPEARQRLNAVARRAWMACELGLVRLLSVKVADGCYRYLAVRTRNPIPQSVIRARLAELERSAAVFATATSH